MHSPICGAIFKACGWNALQSACDDYNPPIAGNAEKEFAAGDVARFSDKEIHGLLNDGDEEFVYISVTAPPINFGYAYKDKK